ncbi:hypothetical protein AOQ71_36410 [Bradyrhizobium manausense]|uniref:Uncharacterized protein n=1 Tax=Bradyrhizobium manausense TaxID=989370 RepID=A0A0R3CWS4_9BRAD|nr:hypothetical protein AOQ71_36410 [Bradyrhizobium manausense]
MRALVLDDAKTISHCLLELRGTALDDTALRPVMDIQTGRAYTDEQSSVWALRAPAAGGRGSRRRQEPFWSVYRISQSHLGPISRSRMTLHWPSSPR